MVESLELGVTQRSETAPLKTEAELTFMLARPAVTRWQFETERLRQLANNWSPAKRGLALMESELGLAQIKALADRIEPLTASQNMAVRFEAQETLVALNSVGGRLGSILEEVREEKSRRGVSEIKAPAFAPVQFRRAAAAGRRGHAAPADVEEGRDAPKRQAARFEARYIDHLIGRAPRLVATQNGAVLRANRQSHITPDVTIAPPPADDNAASEQAVRETAYLLWEQDGYPEGRADEYWRRALEMHRSEPVRNETGGAEAADSTQAPHPQQLGTNMELASLFQTPAQEAYDAFAELAATLSSLCEEPEAPEAVVRPAYLHEAPLHDAGS